mmetsp:Transcript_12516/g.26791  ORF Transcript_12516/g.26791 Transcript_12516/m.26791 type:complete len:362 (+) Transcript_12516:217-1302(+)
MNLCPTEALRRTRPSLTGSGLLGCSGPFIVDTMSDAARANGVTSELPELRLSATSSCSWPLPLGVLSCVYFHPADVMVLRAGGVGRASVYRGLGLSSPLQFNTSPMSSMPRCDADCTAICRLQNIPFLASPKSVSLTWPSGPMRTLSGLRSRWMMCFFVQVLQRQGNLSYVELRNRLGKSSELLQQGEEVAAGHVVHDEEEMLVRLEGSMHLHHKRVVNGGENAHLRLDFGYFVLHHHVLFLKHFDGKQFLSAHLGRQKHRSVCSSTNGFQNFIVAHSSTTWLLLQFEVLLVRHVHRRHRAGRHGTCRHRGSGAVHVIALVTLHHLMVENVLELLPGGADRTPHVLDGVVAAFLEFRKDRA